VDKALVACLMPDYPPLLPSARARVLEDVARFVASQVGRAPWLVRLAVRPLGTALFLWLALAGVLASPIPYRRAEAPIHRFASLAPALAAVVRLYRSMTLLAFYEHAAIAGALGLEDPEDRQARFRARRAGMGTPA
jgi:hypothetical protein